jgi:hypothetical protein
LPCRTPSNSGAVWGETHARTEHEKARASTEADCGSYRHQHFALARKHVDLHHLQFNSIQTIDAAMQSGVVSTTIRQSGSQADLVGVGAQRDLAVSVVQRKHARKHERACSQPASEPSASSPNRSNKLKRIQQQATTRTYRLRLAAAAARNC